MNKVLVMKFGGAAVASPTHFHQIASIILDRKKLGVDHQIVVVVSAMGGATDQLIALAKAVHPEPPKREYDMLISVGERVSIALLAMALAKIGVEAVSFTGSQSGIITCENHSAATIVEVKPDRIRNVIEEGKVAIVAGFQGVSRQREITTLGRGGSDTTAVALGLALKADIVEFYKDVPGVYTCDPKKNPLAQLRENLTFEEALALVDEEHPILHPHCLKLARDGGLALKVRSFSDQSALCTYIRPNPIAVT